MTAQLRGTLNEIDGRLFVGAKQQPKDSLIIWPNRTAAYRTSDGRLELIDAEGAVAASAGESIYLGGGFISESPGDDSWLKEVIGEPIPERCRPTNGYFSGYLAEDDPPAS